MRKLCRWGGLRLHVASQVKKAFGVLVFRGEWEQEDHAEKRDVIHTSFVDRSAPYLPR